MAFHASIDELRSAAELERLIKAISANDYQGVIAALHLDPAAFSPLTEAIRQSYMAGGNFGAGAINGLRLPNGLVAVVRFGGQNVRAETWLRDYSATMVTRTIEDTKVGIRMKLTAGMEAGQNPTRTALDIVGRIDRTTGKRVGGLIGLSSPQFEYANSAEIELKSGDPKLLRNYLTRTRRNHNFDSVVLKAIEDGKPIDSVTASKMLTSYRARLLELRGSTIAKLETFTSLETGRHEAYQQATDSGKVPASSVKKRWRRFPSEHPRLQHIAMSGKVVGMNEKFILPDGTQMLHPHDPNAPVKHTAGCRCQADYKINFIDSVL